MTEQETPCEGCGRPNDNPDGLCSECCDAYGCGASPEDDPFYMADLSQRSQTDMEKS